MKYHNNELHKYSVPPSSGLLVFLLSLDFDIYFFAAHKKYKKLQVLVFTILEF